MSQGVSCLFLCSAGFFSDFESFVALMDDDRLSTCQQLCHNSYMYHSYPTHTYNAPFDSSAENII
jgi:hypothetical protein